MVMDNITEYIIITTTIAVNTANGISRFGFTISSETFAAFITPPKDIKTNAVVAIIIENEPFLGIKGIKLCKSIFPYPRMVKGIIIKIIALHSNCIKAYWPSWV